MPRLWRNRDFMLLWSGQTVSAVGSQVSGIALPLLVLGLTHSPAQAGLVGAFGFVPYVLLSLPAGALVDRWNRRRLMVLCDAGRAVNMLSIPVAFAIGHLFISQLYAVALLEGSLFVFFNLAESSVLPRVVAPDDLQAATAQNEAIWGISALAGPPLGSALYGAVARAVPFLVDAASYGLSVLSLLSIQSGLDGERAVDSSRLWQEIAEAFGWLRGRPLLRTVAVYTAAGDLLFSGIDLILIVVARQQMHAPATLVGLIFSLAAVGGIAGSILGGRVRRWMSLRAALLLTGWGIALLYPLFALAPTPLLLGAVWAPIALLVSVSNSVRVGFQLSTIPDALQGRVNSLTGFAAYGSLPLGQALTGALLQTAGPPATILLIFACQVALQIWLTLNRSLASADR